MNDYSVTQGSFLTGDGGNGPSGSPNARMSLSSAAWDTAPDWLRELMPPTEEGKRLIEKWLRSQEGSPRPASRSAQMMPSEIKKLCA
jgi:hypothetical protein